MKLTDIIGATMARYGKQLSTTDLILWLEDLQGIEPEIAAAAFSAHRTDPDRGHFPPTAADIIRRVQGSNEERALIAWAQVRGAVRSYGGYQSVDFGSPLVHGVLHEMGGWSAMNDMRSDQVEPRKAEFVKRYMTYAGRGILPPNSPALMLGEHKGSVVQVSITGRAPDAIADGRTRQGILSSGVRTGPAAKALAELLPAIQRSAP